MKYAHYYETYEDDGCVGFIQCVVVISSYVGVTPRSTSWMSSPELANVHAVVPDVDLSESVHTFDEPEDAIAFIKKWWTETPIEEILGKD